MKGIKRYKVLIAGAFNSGKTTFIKTANEFAYDGVEVSNFDVKNLRELEGTTTVGIDISHVSVDDLEFLLVGLPGQERFSFLWDTLGSDFDAILFIHGADLSVEKLKFFIDYFKRKKEVWNKAKKLVVVTKGDMVPDVNKGCFYSFKIPVISCDARNNEDVKNVLKFLYELIKREERL